MVGGVAGLLPSAISRIVLRRILPDRVFGSAGTTSTCRSAATHRPRRGPAGRARAAAAPSVGVHPALSTTRPRGTWPLSSSCDADDRALGHRRDARRAPPPWCRSEPVAGDVDDVVGAAHHEQVAVLVDVAAVAGEVVAVERRQVRGDVAVVVAPERRQRAGRQRQPEEIAPSVPADRLAVAVEHLDVIPGHRHRRRARLDRHRLEPAQVGGDRPAGLGPPPVVDRPARRAARWPTATCPGRAAPRRGTACASEKVVRDGRCAPAGSSFLIARTPSAR